MIIIASSFVPEDVRTGICWMDRIFGMGALNDSRHSQCLKNMSELSRITFDPNVMGGKPCIRGMRVTAGMILGMLASGHSREKILELYPYLEDEDITASLEYATYRAQERELPLYAA